MKCTEARRLLSLDLDEELSTETAFALGRHLDECEACAQRFAAERDLEQRLRRLLVPPAEASNELWRRVEQRLQMPARPLRSYRLLLCMAAGLLGVLAFVWLRERPALEPLQRALAAMHGKVLDGVELPQAEFEDGTAAAAFFGERVTFPVRVASGIDVRGGRVCAIHGRKLALVFARDAGQPVSVFVLPQQLLDLFPAEAQELAEHEVVTGRHGNVAIVLRRVDGLVRAVAGEMSPEHLRRILVACN